MSGPIVNLSVIPTGGACLLQMPEYIAPPNGVTAMTISNAVSGVAGLSAFTQIYSGALLPTFLDVGDLSAAPLNPALQYVYQVSDSRGATQTLPVTPSWTIETQPDQLTQILIRLLQGAVNSMPLPAGIQRTQVTTRMPTNGWQAMPFIICAPELIQQSETQIGEDFPNPDQNNNWTLFALVNRIWRITVFTPNDEERDFYRDTLLAAFRIFKATAFSPMGFNVTHRFQAVSYTDVSEYEGKQPGFYAADLMYELEGVFPVTVLTNYGPISTVSTTADIRPPPGTEGTVITANTR